MTELIRSKQDLIDYLTTKQIAGKEPPKTVNVTTKLRRVVMTDELQGKFIHKGAVRRFIFKSLGGGVYSAEIETKATHIRDVDNNLLSSERPRVLDIWEDYRTGLDQTHWKLLCDYGKADEVQEKWDEYKAIIKELATASREEAREIYVKLLQWRRAVGGCVTDGNRSEETETFETDETFENDSPSGTGSESLEKDEEVEKVEGAEKDG